MSEIKAPDDPKMEPEMVHLEVIWEGFGCLVGVFLELGEHSDFSSPLDR